MLPALVPLAWLVLLVSGTLTLPDRPVDAVVLAAGVLGYTAVWIALIRDAARYTDAAVRMDRLLSALGVEPSSVAPPPGTAAALLEAQRRDGSPFVLLLSLPLPGEAAGGSRSEVARDRDLEQTLATALSSSAPVIGVSAPGPARPAVDGLARVPLPVANAGEVLRELIDVAALTVVVVRKWTPASALLPALRSAAGRRRAVVVVPQGMPLPDVERALSGEPADAPLEPRTIGEPVEAVAAAGLPERRGAPGGEDAPGGVSVDPGPRIVQVRAVDPAALAGVPALAGPLAEVAMMAALPSEERRRRTRAAILEAEAREQMLLGRWAEARFALEEALALRMSSEDALAAATDLGRIGQCHVELGDEEASAASFRDGADLAANAGDRPLMRRLLRSLGMARERQAAREAVHPSVPGLAPRLYREAADAYGRAGDRGGVRRVHSLLKEIE